MILHLYKHDGGIHTAMNQDIHVRMPLLSFSSLPTIQIQKEKI